MISAVANVSDQFSGRNEPVPITSIGAFTLAMTLHFAGLKPELATIFTFSKPASSSAARRWKSAAALTPVPFSQRSSASVRYSRTAFGL